MFEQQVEPLCKGSTIFGQIALLPWDIETFGFGVADYKADEYEIKSHAPPVFKRAIEHWAKENKVELIGTNISSCQISKLCFFQSVGFSYIDTTLDVHYQNIQSKNYPSMKVTVFPAEAEDLSPVVDICGRAFESGRYHADTRVPRHLADRRYQDWARRTFSPGNPQTLLVARIDNQVCSFSIISISGQEGYIHLNAVEPQFQGQQIGISTIASTISYLQKQRVQSVLSRISAANAPAINMHSFLGGRFCNPSVILHWHAPWATHLKKVVKRG
jgi:L-amino acid N-acyltransferase YncA